MNKIILSIDLKSLAIGFLLAIALGVAFSGFWQSKAANENVIVADEEGVYIEPVCSLIENRFYFDNGLYK